MKNSLLLVTTITLAVMACKPDGVDNTNTTPNPSPGTNTTAPVETNPPNSTYQPAFSGQTRVSAVRTNTSFQARVITSSLSGPWGLAPLPGWTVPHYGKSGQHAACHDLWASECPTGWCTGGQ